MYLWANAIYFTLRGSGEKFCVLVIMGVTPEGDKEVLSLSPGQRESKLTWKEILLNIQSRGLTYPPKLAIADGVLGFWSALREVYPQVKEQRCWAHKIRRQHRRTGGNSNILPWKKCQRGRYSSTEK